MPIQAPAPRGLGNITVSKRTWLPRTSTGGFHLCETPRTGKSTDTENRLMVSRGWGEQAGVASGCLRGDEPPLELMQCFIWIVLTGAQLCECTNITKLYTSNE